MDKITPDELESSLSRFGQELQKEFTDAKPGFYAAYGQCLAMKTKLPIEQYQEVKNWLTAKYGEPTQKEPWFPQHTKTCPPLTFHVQTQENLNYRKLEHVNLISMMQRKDKQYVLLSWM